VRVSINVLLFASYADMLGTQSLAIDLPAGSTVAELVAQIRRRPGAERLPASPLVAVNHQYASPSSPIELGDEVALIPPVAGG
jgi:molybdopterin converting factor subunit 1